MSFCMALSEDQYIPSIGDDCPHSTGMQFLVAHETVREEGDIRLASQVGQINPGNQWGDKRHGAW